MRHAPRQSRPCAAGLTRWLAGLIVLLIVFVVGVDAVHEAIQGVTDSAAVNLLVNFVEAGGEVGAMTALLAYVVHIVRRPATHPEPGATVRDPRVGW